MKAGKTLIRLAANTAKLCRPDGESRRNKVVKKGWKTALAACGGTDKTSQ